MKRTQVTSSMIVSIGYDKDEEILEVEFKNGAVYQYYDVPVTEHNALMSAASHGAYLKRNISPVYRYTQI